MNSSIKKRLIAIIIVSVIIFGLIISRIVFLQLFNGEELLTKSQSKILKSKTLSAARGEILDRNYNPLVVSKEENSIFIEKGNTKDEVFNKTLITLYNYFLDDNKPYKDTFPISLPPFSFTQSKNDLLANKDFTNFIKNKIDTKNMTAEKVIDSLTKSYKLTDYKPDEARIIIGINYEIEKNLKTTGFMYEFASNVSIPIITKISENQAELEGIYIEPSYSRKYVYDNFAGHILGTIGKITENEFSNLKDNDYLLNDLIGKEGIEFTYEKYLKGKDGIKQIARDTNGNYIKIVNKKNPIKGNDVVLTIDKDLQETTETSLQGHIESLKKTIPEGKPGHDLVGASVVVMDINNGDVLSLANYPSINPVNYNENYESYKNDTINNPLINRAISSAYPCGSTFKMLIGIAALETDSIPTNFTYNCRGKYTFFPDYQPTCFRGNTHGNVTLQNALKVSCNGFFFDAGRLTGIEKLNDYARQFGFGDYSGIELPGETKGILAGPLYKQEQGKKWTTADTIQFSIGQSDNMFTTMQMAEYISTIATNGKRYKPHIVKEVIGTNPNEKIINKEPELVSEIPLRQSTISSIRDGMTLAISEGGARGYFANCKTPVAGKTGTAEVSNGSSNGTFICYSPIENPQIAIAITAEHIGEGSLLGAIAREIVDKYFQNV